jgi:predicted molibdopterin-dependent oxidoreductase YjgC
VPAADPTAGAVFETARGQALQALTAVVGRVQACGRPRRQPGDPDRFATPDGRAHLAATPYLPPGEHPDETYPLILITGRGLAHYNSGSMTRRTDDLLLDPVDHLDIHPDDAVRHGLRDGQPVTVESRHGRARLTTASATRRPPGRPSAPSTSQPAVSTASPRTTQTPRHPAPSTPAHRRTRA